MTWHLQFLSFSPGNLSFLQQSWLSPLCKSSEESHCPPRALLAKAPTPRDFTSCDRSLHLWRLSKITWFHFKQWHEISWQTRLYLQHNIMQIQFSPRGAFRDLTLDSRSPGRNGLSIEAAKRDLKSNLKKVFIWADLQENLQGPEALCFIQI